MSKQIFRYQALACDYDGTLATQGMVSSDVITALRRLADSGRRLILATGRTLEELFEVFQQVDLFDYLVCENGALLYRPSTRETKLLAEPTPKAFINALRTKNITPLAIGRVVVATWHPNERIILDTIQELGLDLQIIFNKGAVMVLPPGINKSSGVLAALAELGLSKHNVVGIGDAENDHVLLNSCECLVAVANALPALKEAADLTTKADHGKGVIELIDRLLVDDLEDCGETMHRHDLVLGTDVHESAVKFNPFNTKMLLAGPSQSGKSTVCMSLLEHLASAGYQYCVIDPEGDYERAPHAVTVGNRHYAPEIDDVIRILENADDSVVVNLLGLALDERPPFLATIIPRLRKLRQATGRPHWIVIDEAHHMLHPYWDKILGPIWENTTDSLAILTVNPREISTIVLSTIDLVIAVGSEPEQTLNTFAACVGKKTPEEVHVSLSWGEALVWPNHQYGKPFKVGIATSAGEHRRHMRKYADGNLGRVRSFYFTGPDHQLNLRAQNLLMFMQIGEGVDDATWLYHLHNGDYSNWFSGVINDPVLAEETRNFEGQKHLSANETRARIRYLIENRYTAPARSIIWS